MQGADKCSRVLLFVCVLLMSCPPLGLKKTRTFSAACTKDQKGTSLCACTQFWCDKNSPGKKGEAPLNTNLYTCLSVCLHIVPSFPFRRAGVNKSIGCSGDFCLANSRGQRLLIRFLYFKGISLEGPPLTVNCIAVTGACLSRVPARFTPKFIGAAGVPRPGRRLRSALVSRLSSY